MAFFDGIHDHMLFQAKPSWNIFVWMKHAIAPKAVGFPLGQSTSHIDHTAVLAGYLWCADDTSSPKEVMFAIGGSTTGLALGRLATMFA